VIFWDASAIVPLLVAERTTRQMQALAGRDPDMLVWWGSEVECVSALARLERAAALDGRAMALACDRLKLLADGWHEIEPSEIVRENAVRFLRVHPLRAADALQLAAAFTAAERRPASLRVVTLDERLADAARKEGFALVDTDAGVTTF
jgi:predicted nucleic acid-binding protein